MKFPTVSALGGATVIILSTLYILRREMTLPKETKYMMCPTEVELIHRLR